MISSSTSSRSTCRSSATTQAFFSPTPPPRPTSTVGRVLPRDGRGLDTPCSRPSVDRRRLEGRAVPSTVQILLQNGRDQYYLVQETSAGQPVTPCLYFHDLLDDDFETIGDLPPFPTLGLVVTATPFEKEDVDVAPSEIDVVSQSSLNTFVNCPRDYYFDRIVDNPDRDYFQKGNLFHDYAEFYVNHPDVVEGTDRSELVDLMLAEMRPYVPDVEQEPLETEFEIGLDTIEQFVVADPPTNREYSQYERQGGRQLLRRPLREVDRLAHHRTLVRESPTRRQGQSRPDTRAGNASRLQERPTQVGVKGRLTVEHRGD